MQYGVRQGNKKVYSYGDYDTEKEAKEALLKIQLAQKRRGLYIVKLVPYTNNFRQAIKVK